MKAYYTRNLPHYQPFGSTYHVVFRLVGLLPVAVILRLQEERLKQERRIAGLLDGPQRSEKTRELHEANFRSFDGYLDACSSGPRWLERPEIAQIVAEAVRYREGREYDLLAFSIMPNHVHLVVEQCGAPLYRMLQSLKSRTSRRANLILPKRGSFWQAESYDHVIRDGRELERTLWYVINNPVKAGMIGSWEAWPWTYCKQGLVA